MRLRDLTSEDVSSFAAYMEVAYGCRVYYKGDSEAMAVASQLLAAMGYVEPADFMTNYCTTLGNRVYLNFRPGDDTTGVELVNQVAILAHECTHVRQYNAGGLKFAWMYLGSSEERANYEAQAHAAEIPILWRYDDERFDTAWAARTLSGYGCTEADMAMAKDLLDAHAEIAYQGGVTEDTARVAITWLRARGVLP